MLACSCRTHFGQVSDTSGLQCFRQSYSVESDSPVRITSAQTFRLDSLPCRDRNCRNNAHQESHRQILLTIEPARTVKVWVDYLRQHKFPEVWSLWEVPLEPSKRQELLAWPADCKPARLQDHLDNDYNEPTRQHSGADALGLTLLWFGSLYGREQASEGEIWPSVASRFPPESRTVLSARGHRGNDLKWARKSCHRHLELVGIWAPLWPDRHVDTAFPAPLCRWNRPLARAK